MKKILPFVGFVLMFLVFVFVMNRPAFSDQLDDINKQINDLQAQLDSSKNATRPLESQLSSLQSQMQSIQNQVANTEEDITQKKQEIAKGYADLAKQKEEFNLAVRNLYIKNYLYNPMVIFVSSTDANDITRTIAYGKKSEDQDKAIITNLAFEITDLENRKAELEKEEIGLQSAKTRLAAQQSELQKVVDGAKAYQATLTSKIAQLSTQQQQLIAQKQASLGLPTSAYTTSGGCSSDLTNGKDPGFSPGFGFFTYGVPHRVGLSQYGAWGRAKAGQDSDTILHAYFNFDGYQNFSDGITIKVNDSNGYNSGNIIWTGSLEDYVKRVYEVPDSWTDNGNAALKAQAIAARSYVLATTNNGASSICATQSCQVFKTDPKGGNWESAVNDTAGQVMVQGGNPVKAWFSSTAGGYYHSSSDVGWSSTSWTKTGVDASGSVSSFADLQSKAYDRDSPWFYCDWGGRSQYNNTAWLQPDEVADIINALMLAKKDSSTQQHLSQADKPNPDGVETWDANRVKQELKNRGGSPFNSISNISISADFGSGNTTSVQVSGDAGSQSFNGDEFKNFFNLRAPANIQIVGPLYNVEKH